MRVGVIQSSYVPWRGYFDLIRSVDLFVFYDDVQFTARSWRVRNRLKTADGVKWLTVPVVKKKRGATVDETDVAYDRPWQQGNLGLLEASLGRSPFHDDALDLWLSGTRNRPRTISELNTRLIRLICEYLAIHTPLLHSRSLAVDGSRTDRLVNVLKRLKATSYLSGPSAKSYLDENLLRQSGIRLEYKTYDYVPYSQPFGDFVGELSILDLIANLGPAARDHLKSRTPDIAVD